MFYPGDAKGALSALGKLKLGHSDRSEFINKYTRTNIMKKMAQSITNLRSTNNA